MRFHKPLVNHEGVLTSNIIIKQLNGRQQNEGALHKQVLFATASCQKLTGRSKKKTENIQGSGRCSPQDGLLH